MGGLNVTINYNEVDTLNYDQNLRFSLERIHDKHIDHAKFQTIGFVF